jgi:hypothetical protein
MKKWKRILFAVILFLVTFLNTMNVWAWKKYVVKEKYDTSKYRPMKLPYEPLYWGESMLVISRIYWTYDMTSSNTKIMKCSYSSRPWGSPDLYPGATVTAVGSSKQPDVTKASLLCWGYSLKKEWENFWGQEITIQKPYFIGVDVPVEKEKDGTPVIYMQPFRKATIELKCNNLGKVSWSTKDKDHCTFVNDSKTTKVQIESGYSGSTTISAKYKGYVYKLKIVVYGTHTKVKRSFLQKLLDRLAPYSTS